jgi:uncharacterized membrane protein YbhN (UPF0104 family)
VSGHAQGSDSQEPVGGTLQVDRGGFRHRGAVGVVVGLLALGAAIWLITSHRADFRSAVDSIRRASPGLIAAAIVLPALNWFSTTATFWILTRRVGKVGFVEMGALMGSAWLANYLPLKPGLVARIAYHATCNGIHPVASAKVVLQAVVLSALAASSLIVIALGAGLAETASIHNGILLGAAIALACLLAYAVRFSMRLIKLPAENPAGLVPAMIAAFAFRGLDALTWVFRYLVAFELVGAPIGLANATALAAVSQAVAALPLVGSVLGVREWVVGTLSSFLPERTDGQQDRTRPPALPPDRPRQDPQGPAQVPLARRLIGREGGASSPSPSTTSTSPPSATATTPAASAWARAKRARASAARARTARAASRKASTSSRSTSPSKNSPTSSPTSSSSRASSRAGSTSITTIRDKYTGIRPIGPASLRHFKRTYREALKRQVSMGTYDPDNPSSSRSRTTCASAVERGQEAPEQRVIVYMMDVSGSMGDEQKELVRLEAFWIDTWLRRNYEGIESRYIVHDVRAGEVDKKTFFSVRRTAAPASAAPTSAARKSPQGALRPRRLEHLPLPLLRRRQLQRRRQPPVRQDRRPAAPPHLQHVRLLPGRLVLRQRVRSSTCSTKPSQAAPPTNSAPRSSPARSMDVTISSLRTFFKTRSHAATARRRSTTSAPSRPARYSSSRARGTTTRRSTALTIPP